MIYIFQLFNELILRPTAIVLDLILRVPLGLDAGFRAAIIEMGVSNAIASVIAGFIVVGIVLGLIWLGSIGVRKSRLKNAGQTLLWVGTIAFWIGSAIGLYFLAIGFYMLSLPDASGRLLYFVFGTALFYPAIGRLVQYLLGR